MFPVCLFSFLKGDNDIDERDEQVVSTVELFKFYNELLWLLWLAACLLDVNNALPTYIETEQSKLATNELTMSTSFVIEIAILQTPILLAPLSHSAEASY